MSSKSTRKHYLFNGDCLEVLESFKQVDCIFADPPDNIGLGYNEFKDRQADEDYINWLANCVDMFCRRAGIVWISYNAKWTFAMGEIAMRMLRAFPELEAKACVQVFTFGQHRDTDLGNNHRPLIRFRHKDAPLYPDQIRIPSWRQRNGDKRASSKGRVPGDVFDMQYPTDDVKQQCLEYLDRKFGCSMATGAGMAFDYMEKRNILPGDVFDFPRVTGNSKQRCDWHPTQLHEELVERCVTLSTKPGGTVIDPFGGTGTTLRVCERIDRQCALIEYDKSYCAQIAKHNGMTEVCGGWEKP